MDPQPFVTIEGRGYRKGLPERAGTFYWHYRFMVLLDDGSILEATLKGQPGQWHCYPSGKPIPNDKVLGWAGTVYEAAQ